MKAIKSVSRFKSKVDTNYEETFLFQAIQFSQTVLIQAIQFSMNIVFVYTQLNIKKSSISNNSD